MDDIIDLALREDIGNGDITTEPIKCSNRIGRGRILAKEPMMLAGLPAARKVFERLDDDVAVDVDYEDGAVLSGGEIVATVTGALDILLLGERTALNFLQRLSGIATHARQYVQAVKGSGVRVVDTRKTTPGLRALEKYAVRLGGAGNHRTGLYDGALIKDNHIAVCGGIKPAVDAVRARISHLIKIEVETATLSQVKEALAEKVDVIMLDNMTPEQIKAAVSLIGGKALVEISGGVNLENISELASSGVDIISVGSLTHGARAMDLSMKIKPI